MPGTGNVCQMGRANRAYSTAVRVESRDLGQENANSLRGLPEVAESKKGGRPDFRSTLACCSYAFREGNG